MAARELPFAAVGGVLSIFQYPEEIRARCASDRTAGILGNHETLQRLVARGQRRCQENRRAERNVRRIDRNGSALGSELRSRHPSAPRRACPTAAIPDAGR